MVPSGRVLDLIEAIEVSAEKSKYLFSPEQLIMLLRLKVKAKKEMPVSNNYWELLCDLFNEIEGRKNPHRELVNEAFASQAALAAGLIFSVVVILSIVVFVWGINQ